MTNMEISWSEAFDPIDVSSWLPIKLIMLAIFERFALEECQIKRLNISATQTAFQPPELMCITH